MWNLMVWVVHDLMLLISFKMQHYWAAIAATYRDGFESLLILPSLYYVTFKYIKDIVDSSYLEWEKSNKTHLLEHHGYLIHFLPSAQLNEATSQLINLLDGT